MRNLEREIAKVCRKVARKIVNRARAEGSGSSVTPETVSDYLGKIKFHPRRKNEKSEVGVATGLAWTEAGGELLETEVGLMPGKGKLILTGKLGEVMQESARAAVSYLRSRAETLGVDPDFNDKYDLHLHVPEGAIPKDGPSAGITMATALDLGSDRCAGAKGPGDDRRDHAARQGLAGRWGQAQASGGLPGRYHRVDLAEAERERSRRDPRRGP